MNDRKQYYKDWYAKNRERKNNYHKNWIEKKKAELGPEGFKAWKKAHNDKHSAKKKALKSIVFNY